MIRVVFLILTYIGILLVSSCTLNYQILLSEQPKTKIEGAGATRINITGQKNKQNNIRPGKTETREVIIPGPQTQTRTSIEEFESFDQTIDEEEK